MRRITLAVCLIAATAFAQDKPTAPAQTNPYSAFTKEVYTHVKELLLRSAEKMPEESYSFKPVDTVRSYGQIIGHLADAQYYFCSTELGEKGPDLKIEKTKTSKSDLIGALKDAFTYCDKAYDSITDAAGTATVKLFGKQDTPKLGVLTVNNLHNLEHYGNLVTYMRIKNIVPPSSEQAPQSQPKK